MGLPKTFDGHTLGDFIVGENGISRITEVDGYAGYKKELILPKDIFIEAYNKYIKNGEITKNDIPVLNEEQAKDINNMSVDDIIQWCKDHQP